jgi:hypothetical protein
LKLAHALLDPLDRRRAEDLLATPAQSVDFFAQRVDAAFGFGERLRQRLAAATFADEVDEVGKTTLLGGELGLLELQRVRQIGAELVLAPDRRCGG